MAKLSRNDLKGIVKECLIEILNEGISGDMPVRRPQISESRLKSRTSRASVAASSSTPSRSVLDSITYGNKRKSKGKQVANEKFDRNVSNTIENLTSDPILSSIFQDTARTTLQEQKDARVADSGMMSHEAAVLTQGDSAARVASQSDPMDMFSESSEKWAQLAFSSPTSK